jgi:hypothetical protein
MKKLPLLFLFISPFFSKAQTNVYHPFPDSNAVWNVHTILYGLCNWSGAANEESLNSYILTGDTVIGSYTYHKIETPVYLIAVTGDTACDTSYTIAGQYSGAIRQDTVSRKVFFIEPDSSSEVLLYDFTLQVGDTVRSYITRDCNAFDDAVVGAVDSVLIDGSYRNRWRIHYLGWPATHVIEGIGSTSGLLEQVICPFVDGAQGTLVCFKENGIVKYPDTPSNCDLLTAMQVNPDKIVSYSIYPNPAHNSFTITSPFQNARVEIYNVLGEKVYSKGLTPGPSPKGEGSTVSLDVRPGIYFVEVREIPQGGMKVSDRVRVAVEKLVIE